MVPDPRTPARAHELRPLNLPQPLTVEVDAAGTPLVVVLHERRLAVTAIQEVWRIEDEWWREPISRRYYLVLLDGGVLRTIYQDLVDGAWYEQHG